MRLRILPLPAPSTWIFVADDCYEREDNLETLEEFLKVAAKRFGGNGSIVFGFMKVELPDVFSSLVDIRQALKLDEIDAFENFLLGPKEKTSDPLKDITNG